MRVLMLSNFYPPYERGGYEQLCRDVAERLVQRGHEVAVLTSSHEDTPGHSSAECALVYRCLRFSPDYESRVNPAMQFYLSRRAAERDNRRQLASVVNEFVPDIIFIWNLQGIPRTVAVEAESFPQTAVAYWLAGYSPAEPDEYWNYWSGPGTHTASRMLRRIFRRHALRRLRLEGKPIRPKLEHVAVVSEFMRRKGIAQGTLPEHTEIIPNGVELEDFFFPVKQPAEPLKLLQAGRVSADKGVHVSVAALILMLKQTAHLNVHLSIAGSGPETYRSQLEMLVRDNDLQSHVTFLGWRPRDEMPQIMKEHDGLLLPSIHDEAFARVVLEAMAAGLFVVAATPGGTGEIIEHDRTGLLCPPDDEVAMAAQISRLLNEPELGVQLARAGQRSVVEKFSLEIMVDNLEAFLEKAVEQRVML